MALKSALKSTIASCASLLGFLLLFGPSTADAQSAGKAHRIGLLETRPTTLNAANVDALRKGLQELAHVSLFAP
jgi:hypothetical protein